MSLIAQPARPEVQDPLARLRGQMAPVGPSVRRLAAFANVHSCPTAAVAFAAGVDTNRVLAGVDADRAPDSARMEMPFGQSPFAIGRGFAFEALLRRNDHAELRRVLTDGLGVDFSAAAVDNLRERFPRNGAGLPSRAAATQERMAEIISGPSRPVVLDGAVLKGDVGGQPAYFEADEMAIGVGGGIVIGENKSWPVVDGRPTDEDALGAALDQAATYVLLGRRTLDDAGMDPAALSARVVLITPRNTGLTPVLHQQNVDGRIRRVERLLQAVPDVAEVAATVPSSVTFARVADRSLSGDARLDALAEITTELGTAYEPGSCLASCGLAWACRSRAYAAGDPTIAGDGVVRALPGIEGLDRVAALGHGAAASPAEQPAAETLARAGRLYDETLPSLPLLRSA